MTSKKIKVIGEIIEAPYLNMEELGFSLICVQGVG
jgi:hypothetical protein